MVVLSIKFRGSAKCGENSSSHFRESGLEFINFSSNEQREQLKNNFSETLHRELDIYNGMNRLYDMLPVIESKYYEKMEQENENVRSESACDEKKDMVE